MLTRPSRLAAGLAWIAGVAVLSAQGLPPPPPPPPPPPIPVQRDAALKPQTGTARLSGVIVANDAGAQPVRRAILLLNGGDLLIARQSSTDDQGRFTFSGLPGGRYTLQAWRSGFVRDTYGNKRPGVGAGAPIIVGDGERVGITMKMTRSAAITGTILPSGAAPTPSIRVQAMQFQTIAGERRLINALTGGVSPVGGAGGTIDDRGVYRIYGLAPGDYVVATTSFSGPSEVRQVTPAEVRWAQQQFQPSPPGGAVSPPPRGRSVGYAWVYYPGTADPAAAATITLAPGDDRSGIDFPLQLVPVAQIDGTVVGPDGQPPQAAQMTLVASGAGALIRPVTSSVRSTPDGKFTATSVMPGHYTLTARAAPRGVAPASGRGSTPAAPSLWGTTEIDVDGRDLTGVVVALQPGATISGRIAFDGQAPPIDPAAVRVILNMTQQNNALGSAPAASGAADGTFAIPGVGPGSYRLTANAYGPQGPTLWTLKSVVLTIDGHDLQDDAIDIRPGQAITGVVVTFTDRPARLLGTLVDAGGQPTSDYFIVAFPTERRYWTLGSRRVVQARPSNTGAFSITTLPAGEYYVCAVTDVDSNELYDVAFLESLMRAATKVTLADGEQKIQNLKLTGGS